MLPFSCFLLSKLLPLGLRQPKLNKFTGHDAIGEVPLSSSVEALIHAWIHFAFLFSLKQVLLCDIQGAVTWEGTNCMY
jgi:hypothetical protein